MKNTICEIKGFSNQITVVKQLQTLIKPKYTDLFYAVLAHGSVATNELIPYSDFDGLLIVKDDFVNSAKLESFKKESMKIILKFDPLQHHGWFQIKESDLQNYPENYLPVTTLNHAKLIFPKLESIILNLSINDNIDYKSNLIKMLNQFEKREAEHWRPKNMFQLKSILSQIMLVPCLYYSVKNNEGIFKRESFDAVRNNFTQDEWFVIEVASKIREEWNPQLNSVQRKILEIPNRLIRKAVVKFMPISIPDKHLDLLNEDFYSSLLLLTRKIKNEI